MNLKFKKKLLSERLKLKRNELKITRNKAAEFIGVSLSTLQAWESVESPREPTISDLIKLSELLNEPIEYLIGMRHDNTEINTIQNQNTSKNIANDDLELIERFKLASFETKAEIMSLLSTRKIITTNNNELDKTKYLHDKSEKLSQHHIIMAKEFLNLPDDIQREILGRVGLQKSGQGIEYKKRRKEN